MSYYTITPTVRNHNTYIDNFCKGKWKILHNEMWIELTHENTRVRDKNNRTWIETCNGHIVETDLTDSNLDCKCFGKNFSETLNRSLSQHVTDTMQEVDMVLYGNVLDVSDSETFLYILYSATNYDSQSLRLYCINKKILSIDSITIDTVSNVDNVVMNVSDCVYIHTHNLDYKIDSHYTIEAYAPTNANKVTLFNKREFKILNSALYCDGEHLFNVMDCKGYSIVDYDSQICFAQYCGNNVSFYNTKGVLIGESISDAKNVFFYNQFFMLISIECYDTYFRLTGIEP